MSVSRQVCNYRSCIFNIIRAANNSFNQFTCHKHNNYVASHCLQFTTVQWFPRSPIVFMTVNSEHNAHIDDKIVQLLLNSPTEAITCHLLTKLYIR